MSSNKEHYGIILDGLIEVGRFEIMSSEDIHGKRPIYKITLKQDYFDLAESKSKNLNFKFIKKIKDRNYTQIEDYGVGKIESAKNIWADTFSIKIEEAYFSKSSQNKNLSEPALLN